MPVLKAGKKAAAEPIKRPSENQDYQQLLASAEALLTYARSLEGHANGDLRKLKKKIDALMQ